MFGALLIFTGVILVNVTAKTIGWSRREWFAVLAAVSFGFENTNDRILLDTFPLYVFVSLAFVAPAIMIAILSPVATQKIPALLHGARLKTFLALCVVYAASAITFFWALQIAPNSSQIASINLSSVVLTVILAIIFLREHDRILQKLVGAAATFAGLLLLK